MDWDRWPHIVARRFRSLFLRRQVEAELTEELEGHVERLTAELRAGGLTTGQARTEALRRFGGVERHKEACRDTRGLNLLEHLLRDLRFGLRGLRRQPGFALIGIATLALGIGSTTAMFTVVERILLRPLDYHEPERLVVVAYERSNTVAAANFLDFQSQSRSFAAMGAAEYWTPNLSLEGRPEEVEALRVTPEIFPLLGVAPLLGRSFTPDEARSGNQRVAVLSYRLWQSRFAGDSGIVRRSITLDGEPYQVVGVMPPAFGFAPYWATGARLWAPLVLEQRASDRAGSSLRVFARLNPGVTIDGARREIAALAARLNQEFPGTNPAGTVVPLMDLVVGDVREPLTVLFAAVGLVLLIACANVAHLQLLRAAAREREFALRGALGASRGRLVQQSLIESMLLALAGGAAGLALAWAAVRLLVRLAPSDLPRLDTLTIDPVIPGFVLLVSLGSTLLFGLLPALTAARADLHGPLKESSRSSADSPRRQRFRAMLVTSEFALALVLLAGAGLLLRSFAARQRLDPGFRTSGVFSAVVSLRGTAHAEPARRGEFYRALVSAVRQLPGVTEASLINHLPLHGDNWYFPYAIEGRPLPAPGSQPRSYFRIVRPGYFGTMGIAILAGRDFNDQDLSSDGRVVIINQAMARSQWPGESPLGHRLSVDDPARGADWFTVVGVVGDSRQAGWTREIGGEMYFPHLARMAPADLPGWQGSLVSFLNPVSMTLVIHSRQDPQSLLREVQALVGGLDQGAAVADVLTMDDAVAEQLAEPRFQLTLLAGFALLALILAAVGIYGVMSYAVARRSHEIGIRMALGAGRSETFALVVRQGMRLALMGSGVGLAGALILSRYLRGMLFGVDPTDPLTLGGVTLVLALVGFAAAAIPGRRAARVNPLTALRAD